MLVFDLLQWGNAKIQYTYNCQPRQNDEHRKSTNRPCDEWPTVLQLIGAHEAFSMQDVKALTS